MTDQEKKGLFKNEVREEEIDRPMFFKSFPWRGPIKSMTMLTEKLTDAGVDYAIEPDNKEKCFDIYINDKLRASDVLEEE